MTQTDRKDALKPLSDKKIAVIGAGKMGQTLIRGWLGAGTVAREQIVATTAHQSRADHVAQQLGVSTTLDNVSAAQGADIVLLCVKPQVADPVLAQIGRSLRPDQLLISILASVTSVYIERRIEREVPVVRAMPNTPSLIGAGMTALCAGGCAPQARLEEARSLFEPLGRTALIDEKLFDAVTGLSASGPAFIYIVIEALAEGGVKVGLPRKVATELAAQACLGAASMVLETGAHPALLKDEVTTPAGCTIDGILRLEEGGLRVTLIKAIVEAQSRASELVQDS